MSEPQKIGNFLTHLPKRGQMYEPQKIEKEILEFWEKNKIFEKSLKKNKEKKPYIFYDGPPFATGMPHYGHILGSVTKDVYGRFWTMKGRYVRRVWGWDCHGLPIENIAEKGLGINSRDEIEKMGIKKFNDYCRSKVLGYSGAWKEVITRIGRWVDMENSYKTMDNEYIESVWWAFKQLWEKGYIYEGEKILMYCPRCSTPLAKAEIAMDNSYKNIKEDSIVVKFKLNEKKFNQNIYALAWTTTPWTLPSNLALTVNPDLEYVYLKDKSDKNIYLLAKKLVNNFFKNPQEYEILEEIKGRKLEGKEYEPLFDYFKNNKNSFKFLLGNFVTADDGTGIVHTAPAFGEDDYAICKKYGISMVQPVDDKGKFTKEVKDFQGKFVHDSNKEIIEFLKKLGKIILIKKIEHEYPFCYRCETKLLYRAIPAWFVDIQKIKPKLLKISQKINWHPEFLKEGRVKYTIETAPDWNISRNRYWATAMPVWVSKDGEKLIIGSVEELKKYAKNISGKIDLHKDFLDEIILEKNGKEFRRIPEVLDCWFESGAMTFAQFHYPFENKKLFSNSFPSQFVAEYIAQVRAWFYYMMVLSTILFEEIPFENVVTTGTVLAEDGEKMSKSKNNFTDPMILINKYGVDALRFYLMSSPVMNSDDLNFSDKSVEEAYKKIILLVYNSLNFYESCKNNEKVNAKKKTASKAKTGNFFINSSGSQIRELTDQWILFRLNQFGEKTEKYLEEYNTIKACVEIREFAEDLSTWYLRINRDRISEEKEAKETLRFVLNNFSKIISPILPFISEKIYQSLNGNECSVHLEEYPKFKSKKSENKLLDSMKNVREIISSGLKTRDKLQIGLKWPLAKAIIKLKKELKLKKEEQKTGNFLTSLSSYPQGYKGKSQTKELLELIKKQLNVKKLEITTGNELSVDFDTAMTPELEAEGYAREISRQIQAFRKELGLEKSDWINLQLITDEEFKKILEKKIEFIKERTNSKKIIFESKERFKKNIEFKVKEKRGVIGIAEIK